jgi:inosine/xanthosine triphosphatase
VRSWCGFWRMAQKKSLVAVGSRNRAKTEGVRTAFERVFPHTEFTAVDVTSKVRAQPLSLDETVEGARWRAELAIKSEGAAFGVGVEAGLVELVKGFFLNVQIAAIVDSAGNLSYGCSSGFPIPTKFVSKVRRNNEELDRYTHELVGTKKVREEEGIVYRLSQGRLSRVEMTEQCVSMALIPWLNPKQYALK